MFHYGFKDHENLNDYQYWFEREAMPRLSRQQREQAIGRLHAGQAARVIANDFNCSTRTMEVYVNVTMQQTAQMTDRVVVDHR